MNMKKAPNTNKLKYVGAALLEGESVTLIQAARLVLEIKEALGDEICTITRCREVVSLGLNAIKNKHQTVSFGTAAVECLRSKSHRRPRTLTDIRSIIHKLKKSNPELEHTSLRNLSVEECQNILMNTFTTSRQRHGSAARRHAFSAGAGNPRSDAEGNNSASQGSHGRI